MWKAKDSPSGPHALKTMPANSSDTGITMNKRKAQMERRTFLQMSSGSLAAFASRGLWRSWPVGTPGPQRHKPSESIQLASSKLKILLDRQDGLPFEYQLLPNYGRFRGEELGEQITATICDRSAWKFATVPI